MKTEIKIHLVPDDSLTDSELETLFRQAEQRGQTPDEYVAGVIKLALTETSPTPHPEQEAAA